MLRREPDHFVTHAATSGSSAMRIATARPNPVIAARIEQERNPDHHRQKIRPAARMESRNACAFSMVTGFPDS